MDKDKIKEKVREALIQLYRDSLEWEIDICLDIDLDVSPSYCSHGNLCEIRQATLGENWDPLDVDKEGNLKPENIQRYSELFADAMEEETLYNYSTFLEYGGEPLEEGDPISRYK